MKKIVMGVLLLAMVIFSPIGQAEQRIDITNGYLHVEGTSNNLEDGYKKATDNAYHKLLKAISSVRVDSSSTVEDLSDEDASLCAKINSALKQISLEKRYLDEAGVYHVCLKLPIYGKDSIVAAVVPVVQKNVIKERLGTENIAESSKDTSTEEVAGLAEKYSGVVIDCTGLRLNKYILPSIFDEEGRVVFDVHMVSREKAINSEYVQYVSELKDDSCVGKAPLKLKAIDKKSGNPIISLQDSTKFLITIRALDLSSDCKVVFLR